MSGPLPSPGGEQGLAELGFEAFPDAVDDPDWNVPAARSHTVRRPSLPIVLVAGALALVTAAAAAVIALPRTHAPAALTGSHGAAGHGGPAATVTATATVTVAPTPTRDSANRHAAPTRLRAASPPVTRTPIRTVITTSSAPARTVTQHAPAPSSALRSAPRHSLSTSTTSSLTCNGRITMTVSGNGSAGNSLLLRYPGGSRTATGSNVTLTVTAGAGTFTATDTGVNPQVALRQTSGPGVCS